MALPNQFANETNPVMGELDENFDAIGESLYIGCTVTGSANALSLTPQADRPSINGYEQLQGYSFIAASDNTSSVTLQIIQPNLAALNAYKPSASGPVVLSAGDIRAGEYYVGIYDAALNAGSGGFHVLNIAGAVTGNVPQSFVLAGPTSTTPQPPSFRRLLASDISGINASAITLGAFSVLGNPSAAPAAGTDVTFGTLFSFVGSTLQSIAFTGDVFSPANSPILTLSPTVTAGVYGSANSIPIITLDQGGRATAISVVAANFSGTVTTARTITAGNALSGGGDLSTNRTIALAYVPGITTGTFGSATAIPVITLNSGGQVTNVTAVNMPTAITSTSGKWTPAVSGSIVSGTQTYSNLTADFQLNGNVVTFNCNILIANKDSATSGNISIHGLPLPHSVSSSAASVVTPVLFGNVSFGSAGTYTVMNGQIINNASHITLGRMGPGQGADSLNASDLNGTNVRINVSGQYPIN